jgi:hypothetical protein
MCAGIAPAEGSVFQSKVMEDIVVVIFLRYVVNMRWRVDSD